MHSISSQPFGDAPDNAPPHAARFPALLDEDDTRILAQARSLACAAREPHIARVLASQGDLSPDAACDLLDKINDCGRLFGAPRANVPLVPEEETKSRARREIILAIDKIRIGALVSRASAAERERFGIGAPLQNDDDALADIARGLLEHPQISMLRGVSRAEISDLHHALCGWNDALENKSHPDARAYVCHLLSDIALRARDLQCAADLCFPADNPENQDIRRKFHLPLDAYTG